MAAACAASKHSQRSSRKAGEEEGGVMGVKCNTRNGKRVQHGVLLLGSTCCVQHVHCERCF